MTQIKVGLSTVIGDKNFAVLIRAHCPRINIDIRIKFLDRYLIAAAFQQTSKRSRCDPFSPAKKLHRLLQKYISS